MSNLDLCEKWTKQVWNENKEMSFILVLLYFSEVQYEELNLYIAKELPGYRIEKVVGDGLCVLNAFMVGMKVIGKTITVDDAKLQLQQEILSRMSFYMNFIPGVDIGQELLAFSRNPLRYYNTHTCDLFLHALGKQNNVGIKIFQIE